MEVENQIITLAQSHPRFNSYLHGTFSATQRALPIRSLNVGTSREEVTFSICDIAKIHQPPFIIKWATAFRVRQIFINLFPIALAWPYLVFTHNSINFFLGTSIILALVSLHIAIHLFNEYFDHLRGWDRISSGAGTQVIQKGWVTAQQIYRLGIFFLFLSVLTSAPAMVTQPLNTLIWGSLGLIAVTLVSLTHWKHPGLVELATLLLLGPALLMGFSSVVAATYRSTSLFPLGLYCGGASAWNYYLKNIQNMMYDWKTNHSSLPLYLGYDKSKQWGWVFFVLNGMSLIVFSWYHTGWLFSATAVLTLWWIGVQVKLLRKLTQIPSCLSSQWPTLRNQSQRIHKILLFSWFFLYFVKWIENGLQ